jgi:hypothetical protein
MVRGRRPRFHALGIVAVSAWFCAAAGSAAGYGGVARAEPQTGHTPSPRSGTSSARQEVDHVPLKDGIWEQSLSEGPQVVLGPLRQELCPVSSSGQPFPSWFAAQNFGRTFMELMYPNYFFWRLSDGRYQVVGGAETSRGGKVKYEHLITLHGDDHYDDELTVTSHWNVHPVKHIYSGSGHWVAPCPVKGK